MKFVIFLTVAFLAAATNSLPIDDVEDMPKIEIMDSDKVPDEVRTEMMVMVKDEGSLREKILKNKKKF